MCTKFAETSSWYVDFQNFGIHTLKKCEDLEEQLSLPISLSDYNLLIQPFTRILRFIAVWMYVLFIYYWAAWTCSWIEFLSYSIHNFSPFLFTHPEWISSSWLFVICKWWITLPFSTPHILICKFQVNMTLLIGRYQRDTSEDV